jgi:hypothetical protein
LAILTVGLAIFSIGFFVESIAFGTRWNSNKAAKQWKHHGNLRTGFEILQKRFDEAIIFAAFGEHTIRHPQHPPQRHSQVGGIQNSVHRVAQPT